MAQFASVFVPFALQAASTAWQQYQQAEAVRIQQEERAHAAQASAEATRERARAKASHTAETADLRNQTDWQAHDSRADAIARETDARIDALNRDFARTELDRADALRRGGASQRARFAAAGLDSAAGSAGAVLSGLGRQAATGTRRARAAVDARASRLADDARAETRADWEATAEATNARTHKANLDIWDRQVGLETRLHELGVQQKAADRRDLLDLTLSNQRAVLGLGRATLRGAGRARRS